MARDLDEWFWKIGNDLQRLSEEMRRSGPTLAGGKGWEPRVDLMEGPDHLILRAEIAGVRGEDINLVYLPSSHSLLIRGVRLDEDNPSGYYQLEIYYGEFQREVRLPDLPVDIQRMKAQYKNGFLTVAIPKAGHVTVTHEVTIRRK